MKTLNEFLLEREIKGNKIAYDKAKTQELREYIHNCFSNGQLFNSNKAIDLLQQGAELLPEFIYSTLEGLGMLIAFKDRAKDVEKFLLYIKEYHYNVLKMIGDESKYFEVIFEHSISTPNISALEFILKHKILTKVNSTQGISILGYCLESPRRYEQKDIKAIIDILVKYGYNINDTTLDLDSNPFVKMYLNKLGRTI